MGWFLFLLLLIAGIVAGYIFVLRPFLKALPALKGFYAKADTTRQKLSALAWHSLTVAWSYLMMAGGVVMSQMENIAALLGDPDFKAQMSDFFGADPKTLGVVLIAISVLTFAARLRSMGQD